MLKIVNLDRSFSATGQIEPDEMPEVARLGFRAVINNRPDGESPDQPSAQACREAAEAAGLVYHHIPVTPDTLDGETLRRFRTAVEGSPQPVIAHCRSGARSTLLWSLVEACDKRRDIDAVLGEAGEKGYDLSALRPLIDRFLASEAPASGGTGGGSGPRR